MSEATVDYRPMWMELGLNLESHDALLNVLSQTYGEIFMSQNRCIPLRKKALTFAKILQRGIRKDARGTLKSNRNAFNICAN